MCQATDEDNLIRAAGFTFLAAPEADLTLPCGLTISVQADEFTDGVWYLWHHNAAGNVVQLAPENASLADCLGLAQLMKEGIVKVY